MLRIRSNTTAVLSQVVIFTWCFTLVLREMGVFDSFPPIAIGVCLILATASVFVHAGWCMRTEVRRLRRAETELSQDEAGPQEDDAEASNADDVQGSDERRSETQMLSLSITEATMETPEDGLGENASVGAASIELVEVNRGGGEPPAAVIASDTTPSGSSWNAEFLMCASSDSQIAGGGTDAAALEHRIHGLAKQLATKDKGRLQALATKLVAMAAGGSP